MRREGKGRLPWGAVLGLIAAAAAGAACEEPEPEPGLEPWVQADFEATLDEVITCRRSPEHDLSYVRIFANALASGTYLQRDEPFAAGSLVIKAEFVDENCGESVGFSAMRRNEAGGAWEWQALDERRVVLEQGDLRNCSGCHDECGQAPEGWDGVCAIP